MAIKISVMVRENTLTKSKIASARIVDLQSVKFSEFCEYLAQDSTVGAADVAAVMTQLEKKLPLMLSLGTKVEISNEGLTVRPTISGSLTQEQLKAKLQARYDAGEDVDVNRELKASDLPVSDLTAGISIDFSKKFKQLFDANATLKRVASTSEAAATEEGEATKPSGSGDSGQGIEG